MFSLLASNRGIERCKAVREEDLTFGWPFSLPSVLKAEIVRNRSQCSTSHLHILVREEEGVG